MRNQLAVLVATPCYPTSDNPVPGVFVKTSVDSMVRCGAKVEVVAPVAWVPPGFGRLSRKWSEYTRLPAVSVDGGAVIRRPRFLQVPWGMYLCTTHYGFTPAVMNAARSLADVVHGHFAYPCGLAASRYGRVRRVPSVLTCHGGDVYALPYSGKLHRRAFLSAVRGVDSVLAVSEALASITLQLSGIVSRVTAIGIDMQRFKNPGRKLAMRQALGLPVDRKVVLFVGAIEAFKGVDDLLQAIQLMSDPSVVAVLLGAGSLLSRVRQSYGVLAAGRQPNEKVAMYLAAADLFVLPSWGEGLPTVLVEAGAMGVPIVATCVGGIPELLQSNRGFLIPAHDPQAIARSIRTALESRALAEAQAANLRSFVLEHYDSDKNAAKLLELYSILIERREAVG